MMVLDHQSQGAAHWSREQYENLFAGGQQPSERFAWIVEDEHGAQPANAAGAELAILGFLVAHRIDPEWELENIVVAETARRSGAGTALLAQLVACARAEGGREMFLEVRESNRSARAFYLKAGFEETGLRKSYYLNPNEDAILYRLKLY